MYVKRVAGAAFAAALGMSGLTVGTGLADATPLKTDPACIHCGPIADDPPVPVARVARAGLVLVDRVAAVVTRRLGLVRVGRAGRVVRVRWAWRCRSWWTGWRGRWSRAGWTWPGWAGWCGSWWAWRCRSWCTGGAGVVTRRLDLVLGARVPVDLAVPDLVDLAAQLVPVVPVAVMGRAVLVAQVSLVRPAARVDLAAPVGLETMDPVGRVGLETMDPVGLAAPVGLADPVGRVDLAALGTVDPAGLETMGPADLVPVDRHRLHTCNTVSTTAAARSGVAHATHRTASARRTTVHRRRRPSTVSVERWTSSRSAAAQLGRTAASRRLERAAASRRLEPAVGRAAPRHRLCAARFRGVQLQRFQRHTGLQPAVRRMGILVLRHLDSAVLT